MLNAIADAIDVTPRMLTVAECWENGKPVRETLNADLPLAIDHFRYFAATAHLRVVARENHRISAREGQSGTPTGPSREVAALVLTRSTS